MALPASLANSNPARRLRFAGTLRKPVGGGVRLFDQAQTLPGKGKSGPANQFWERGATKPLTVTAVSQELIPADADRKFLYIVNNDPLGIVYVTVGGIGAALLQGFTLGAGGGGILLDYNVPTAKIHMIGTIANNPNVTAIIG